MTDHRDVFYVDIKTWYSIFMIYLVLKDPEADSEESDNRDNHIQNIMKGGTQGFPRHEVSDKQEVLFEDVSPSTAFSIRQLDQFSILDS